MKSLFSFFLMLAAWGCTSLADRQHAAELSRNRLDHEYCANHGLNYPDAAYIQCRRHLVDVRLYRQWQNSEMLRRSTPSVQGGALPAAEVPRPYRAPDPRHFYCRSEPQFGNDYVFCDYDVTDTGG